MTKKKPTAAAKARWPEQCFTCGAAPAGTFNDGSPRFDCHTSDPVRHVARKADGTEVALT